jgi:VWFA-related protein
MKSENKHLVQAQNLQESSAHSPVIYAFIPCKFPLIPLQIFIALLITAFLMNDVAAQTKSTASRTQKKGKVSQRKRTSTSVPTSPQPAPHGAPDEATDEPGISIATNEVLLPITVRDQNERFVSNLTAQNFSIYEDGVQQQVSSFALKRLPVHVLLMLDTSSSVQREIEDFKAAALDFAERLDAQDSLSLIKFDDRIELVLDWTTSRGALRRSLNRLTTGMFTKFHDAMYLAAHEHFTQVKGRKAIIVFTDGVDSGRGRKTANESLRALLEAETPVYVISKTQLQRLSEERELSSYENQTDGTRAPSQLRADGLRLSLEALAASEKQLTRMAQETGGRIILPLSFSELGRVFEEIADELRSQYAIFYTPADLTRDGRYRTIRVKVNCTGCRATTRFGYYLR